MWEGDLATPLNFIDPAAAGSAVVVTTRIRGLLSDAAEVQCEVMGEAAALELLLRAGGREDLLECPPPAAVAAVKVALLVLVTLLLVLVLVVVLVDVLQELF